MAVDILAKIKQEISYQVGQELGIGQDLVYKVIEYPPRRRWEI